MASGNTACSFSIFEIAKLFLEKFDIATLRWQTKSTMCNVNAASLRMLASTKVSLKKITVD